MIDTLMMAYTVETVSVEKVVVCMQQYSTDYAEGDVPYDTEDAVTSWMNKVVTANLSNIPLTFPFLPQTITSEKKT